MTPDRERLVLDTLPLVERVAGAFVRKLPPHADGDAIRGAALEGLVKAATRYDGRRPWDGFCRQHVLGAMLSEVRRLDPAKNRSTTADRNRVEARQVPLPRDDDLQAPVDEFGRARSRVDLVAALRRLTARQRYVVAATEILDRRGLDVAATLGVQEARVSQIRAEAFRELRPRLAG